MSPHPAPAAVPAVDHVPARERVVWSWTDPLAPLTWFVVPLPLWWLLGLANLGWFLVAVPMGAALLARRRIRWPPASGWWLLFCLWLALSTLMLGEEPAGTLDESAVSRIVPVAFRFAEYGAATVVLVWSYTVVGTGPGSRERLVRMVRLLGLLLVWTVLGGVLGALAPQFEVTSLVERLLPAGLVGTAYVSALVHPAAAQIQDVIGTGNGRPAAPFPYTNSWGNALGLLLPWVVAAASLARTRARRVGWLVLVPLSVVPAVLSLNRGLWLALGLAAAILLLDLLRRGHLWASMTAIAVGVVALLALLATPLGDVAGARQESTAPSDGIRGWSVSRAIEVAETSPVLGYGGTRAQEGSLDTIAVGKSSSCHNCGNLPIGTNGQLWFVLVGQGFVGGVLYIGFHVALLRRFWRDRSVIGTCGAVTAALSLFFALVYDRTGPTGCIELLALGVCAAALGAQRPHEHDPAATSSLALERT